MSSCFSVQNLCRHYIFWVIYVSGFAGSLAAVKTFSPSGPVFTNSWHQAEPFVFTGAYLWSELLFKNIAQLGVGGWAFLEIQPLYSLFLLKLHFTGLKPAPWGSCSPVAAVTLDRAQHLCHQFRSLQIKQLPSSHPTDSLPWQLPGCAHWRGSLLHCRAALQGG